MQSRSPKSAPAGRAVGSLFLRLVLCLGCLALSLWGIWVCRALVHSTVAGDVAGPNRLIGALAWLVLFGPFAALGGYGLVRTWERFRRAQAEKRAAEPAHIFPPERSAAPQTPLVASTISQPEGANIESLDDGTRQRLDKLGALSAKLIGTGAGLLFLLSGITGFVLAWMYTHRALEIHSSIHYELANFRLISVLLVGCGLAVLVGGFILRETFARPRTRWLVPLQAFTAIAGRKLSAETQLRRK